MKLAPGILIKLFILMTVFLAVIPARAEPPPIKQSGLTCFTITPPASAAKLPPSCEALCEKKGAVCTGVTSPISPPLSCESEDMLRTCRCCEAK